MPPTTREPPGARTSTSTSIGLPDRPSPLPPAPTSPEAGRSRENAGVEGRSEVRREAFGVGGEAAGDFGFVEAEEVGGEAVVAARVGFLPPNDPLAQVLVELPAQPVVEGADLLDRVGHLAAVGDVEVAVLAGAVTDVEGPVEGQAPVAQLGLAQQHRIGVG